ncbi:MAG: zinc ribbon domain-containing protein [Candidatus Nanoarchaeia archaeon]
MADRPIERIETEIDSFYNLIVRLGQVKLDEACKSLNVEKKHILKYVEVLDRAKKIKAKYPFIGQPVFSLPPGQSPNPSEREITPGAIKASFEIPKVDEQKNAAKESTEKGEGGSKEKDEKKDEGKETLEKSPTPVKKEDKDVDKNENQPEKCPKCGNPLKTNAKFCTKCGSEVKR